MAEVNLKFLPPTGQALPVASPLVSSVFLNPATQNVSGASSSFVQLPVSLRSLVPTTTARSPLPDLESILARRSFVSASFISPRQAQTEAWLGRLEETALGSRGIGMLMGGTFLTQLGRSILTSQEFQMTASALANMPRAQVALATLPAVALIGCYGGEGVRDASNDDSSSGDGGSDGMNALDRDGDGYNSNIDCDDTNPSVHPLPSGGGVVTINSNTTVCPGTYHGLNLVIAPGTTGITVIGNGVNLNGDGSDRPAFQLNQVSQTTLVGFNILNYPLGSAVIQLNNAPNNTFQDMTVESPQNRYAFYIDGSPGTTLQHITINSHSDVGVYVNLSDLFTMTNSTITGVPPFDMVLAYGLLTMDGGTGHLIQNNYFSAGSQFGMELYNLSNSMVTGNHVLNNLGDGVRTSSMTTTTFNGNIVNGNQGWGLQMINSSTPDTVTNNNFTGNTLGPVHTDSSSSSGNTFSGNTPPP
jgi:hypothetical protein